MQQRLPGGELGVLQVVQVVESGALEVKHCRLHTPFVPIDSAATLDSLLKLKPAKRVSVGETRRSILFPILKCTTSSLLKIITIWHLSTAHHPVTGWTVWEACTANILPARAESRKGTSWWDPP